MKNQIKILFTDLDGTLLNSDRQVSTVNLNCLKKLGQQGITRVIATGRSFFSYQKVIYKDFPADFLIFSCGAGIIDLSTGSLLISSSLGKKDISYITNYLIAQHAEFMVHQSVPNNHFFTYFGDVQLDTDFSRRVQIYKDYATRYKAPTCLPERSAQIIAIFPEDLNRYNSVKNGLNGFQVTRTTSPLDGKSIWMEIYPPNVSKGESAKWLCQHLQISQEESIGIGNDYNDISLLEFTNKSYIVANAPEEMQQKYRTTLSNNENGFCLALSDAMK